jgi:hypothetical protein
MANGKEQMAKMDAAPEAQGVWFWIHAEAA